MSLLWLFNRTPPFDVAVVAAFANPGARPVQVAPEVVPAGMTPPEQMPP